MSNPALVLNCNNIMAWPVIRLLGKNNIPVDAIFGNRKTKANYYDILKNSKYIRNALLFDENKYEENLINLLIEYGQQCKLKPVLFLASDSVLIPPHLGNTSIATPFYDEQLKQLCEDIYKKLNLVGYANIEIKLDPRDNEYKIIEITTNRCNRQFAVTTLNGLNLPNQLYRFELNLSPQKVNYNFSWNFWMSEANEIRRIKGLKQNKLKEIFLLARRILKTGIFEIFDLRILSHLWH
ncbi:Hypothetical protein IALB_2457 [Ignavibacterium album JCM 16511]|uniref:ATP-grasp domain-containing protein n=1 Tax=Ignavibacterium album (strain DSM 19864 / JCM 16511 / NBRC 101810 / Mat9-16) TaxID=945713 RepID=I0AMF3_IGNAJ|nr:hypothetical protein [Ignavibacterium album]AFH50160.1 Hypothetical protein IALB_2457 [Ignavibacterium album JCM 16511]